MYNTVLYCIIQYLTHSGKKATVFLKCGMQSLKKNIKGKKFQKIGTYKCNLKKENPQEIIFKFYIRYTPISTTVLVRYGDCTVLAQSFYGVPGHMYRALCAV